jgi:hypothetical protein
VEDFAGTEVRDVEVVNLEITPNYHAKFQD